MSSIRTIGKHSPNLTRRKRPVTHGLYLRNNVRALQIRASDVKNIMRKAVDSFPWLREENLPTLRKWASRMQLQSGEQPLDLVAAMAMAASAEVAEPGEAEPVETDEMHKAD